jgi:hypothetical protein
LCRPSPPPHHPSLHLSHPPLPQLYAITHSIVKLSRVKLLAKDMTITAIHLMDLTGVAGQIMVQLMVSVSKEKVVDTLNLAI